MTNNDDNEAIELGNLLKKINLEKKLLKTILPYYDKTSSFDSSSGVTILEFKNYLHDNGFAELKDKFVHDIQSKVGNRIKELDKKSRTASSRKKETEEQQTEAYLQARLKIYDNSSEVPSEISEGSAGIEHLKQIFLIPSWRKLLGKDSFKGFYLNKPVYEIIHDNVLFLPDFAITGFEETMGEPFIFLSGVGIYYVQFRLSPGEIITDHREITGIVLPMDLYDKAQTSASLVSSKDLLMTELMTTIPFALFEVEQTKQMYLRGVIARNIFHPYKESFNQLLKVCKDENSLSIDEGLKVLTGGLNQEVPLYTNEILTEKLLPTEYSRLTAGLKNIQPKLEKIVTDLQIEGLRQPIFEKIDLIKKEFAEVGYPKFLDWMP
ncbi:MAG: hypothetical protein ACTSQ9_05175 [Candidatus Hodarchaeales archaeon]